MSKKVKLSAAIAAGSAIALAIGLIAQSSLAVAFAGDVYDAGLFTPAQLPSPVTGRTLNVLSYGATPNNSSNDDAVAFRNAIAAAVAGDEVYVPDGTYVFKTRKVEMKTGVSVRGQSRSNTVIDAQFSFVDGNSGSYIFGAKPGVNNLTLSNMKLLSNGGQDLNYAVWLGSETGTTNASRIAVRNLQIENFWKMAVSVRNGDNITVENNVIKNAKSTGDGGFGYGVMLGYDNTYNNRVASNTIGPVIRHGVLLQYRAHHNLVESNTVTDTNQDAYDLHGEDEYSNELRGNVARNCSEGGFGVGNIGGTPEHYNAGPNNWIHHNEVSNCKYGIHIYRLSHNQYVEDNYFHHNYQIGMYIHDEGAQNVLFARNRSQYNTTGGARMDNAAGLKMYSNTITNNTGYALRTNAGTINYDIQNNDFRFNGSGVTLGSTNGIFKNNLK